VHGYHDDFDSDVSRCWLDAQIDALQLVKQLRHWGGYLVFVNSSRSCSIHPTAQESLIDQEHIRTSADSWRGFKRHGLHQVVTEKAMVVIYIQCLRLEDQKHLLEENVPDKSNQPQEGKEQVMKYCYERWKLHYRCSKARPRKTLVEMRQSCMRPEVYRERRLVELRTSHWLCPFSGWIVLEEEGFRSSFEDSVHSEKCTSGLVSTFLLETYQTTI
jgi:hypothetical protein